MPVKVDCRADDADKHTLDVNQLLYHKGTLYSAGDDGKIKAWAPDLKFLTEVQAHPCSVYSLTANNDTLYSSSNEGTVKTWTLDTLKEKKTLIKETDMEFWKVVYANGVLYIGDDQGNVKIYKNESSYGSINVAEPVKDMALNNNLLITAKDNDVIVTDLHLDGDKVQFGNLAAINGRAPIMVIDDKLVFISREGKDIIIHDASQTKHLKEISRNKDCHDMIINALTGAVWNGKTLLFSAGWDKNVKQWNMDGPKLKLENSCQVDIVVNCLAVGDEGSLYIAGGDGHIVRVQV